MLTGIDSNSPFLSILNSIFVFGFSDTTERISSAKLIFVLPIFNTLSLDFNFAISAALPDKTLPIIGCILYITSKPKYSIGFS